MNAKLTAVGLGLLVLLTSPLHAQQQAPPPPPAAQPSPGEEADQPRRGNGRGAMAACRGDIRELCGGERGRGTRIACLRQNEAKLSPDCRGAIEGLVQGERGAGQRAGQAREDRQDRQGRGGRLAACQGDLASLCGGVAQGNGGRMRCLRENEAKLSADCAGALQALRDGRKQLRQACASERETICATPEPGSGGLTGCLRQNASRLSEACGAALAGLPADGRMRRRGDRAATAEGAEPPAAPAAKARE